MKAEIGAVACLKYPYRSAWILRKSKTFILECRALLDSLHKNRLFLRIPIVQYHSFCGDLSNVTHSKNRGWTDITADMRGYASIDGRLISCKDASAYKPSPSQAPSYGDDRDGDAGYASISRRDGPSLDGCRSHGRRVCISISPPR